MYVKKDYYTNSPLTLEDFTDINRHVITKLRLKTTSEGAGSVTNSESVIQVIMNSIYSYSNKIYVSPI